MKTKLTDKQQRRSEVCFPLKHLKEVFPMAIDTINPGIVAHMKELNFSEKATAKIQKCVVNKSGRSDKSTFGKVRHFVAQYFLFFFRASETQVAKKEIQARLKEKGDAQQKEISKLANAILKSYIEHNKKAEQATNELNDVFKVQALIDAKVDAKLAKVKSK